MLVVDDEKDARDLIERALEDRGAKITLTDNSRDAIDLLERSEFDVLLADIAIPEEDGYSLDSAYPVFENWQAGVDPCRGGHRACP